MIYMKSHILNIKLLGLRLTLVEVEVFTYVSIHVRLLRDIMSKYCFLLAPLIQLQSADSNNQPMSTSLTVVEVEVFAIVLCAQTLEEAQYMHDC